MAGKGTLQIATGDKYTGEFKDGKMHGERAYCRLAGVCGRRPADSGLR